MYVVGTNDFANDKWERTKKAQPPIFQLRTLASPHHLYLDSLIWKNVHYSIRLQSNNNNNRSSNNNNNNQIQVILTWYTGSSDGFHPHCDHADSSMIEVPGQDH